MAQQNQEINLVDPDSFPQRRKRGRPRKYDGPGYEARRRYLSPQSIPNPANLPGSSQGSSLIPARVNSNLTWNFSPQATSVQVNPSVHPYPDVQVTPTQVNPVLISGTRPEAIPAQPTAVHPPVSRSESMQIQANANCNATSTLHYGIGVNPAQTTPIPNSNISHHHVMPASSSNASHTLVGQPVSGILDGKFDAGYLLTVKVGSTGDVLKGLVFDPQLCVPVSAENDIAPLLPLANSRENPHSVVRTPTQPVPTPICSGQTSVTAAVPIQTREPLAFAQSGDHVPESSTSKDPKITPETAFYKLATNDGNSGHHEMPETVQAKVCTTIPQTLGRETIISENQRPPADGIQHTSGSNVTSEISMCPPFSKEVHTTILQTLEETISSKSQEPMPEGLQLIAESSVTSEIALRPAVSKAIDQHESDLNLDLTEASALDKSVQDNKSLPRMEEAPGMAEGEQQTEVLSKNEKEPEGVQGQNLDNAPSAGLIPEGLNLEEVPSADLMPEEQNLEKVPSASLMPEGQNLEKVPSSGVMGEASSAETSDKQPELTNTIGQQIGGV